MNNGASNNTPNALQFSSDVSQVQPTIVETYIIYYKYCTIISISLALLCPMLKPVPNSAGWNCITSRLSLPGQGYPYRSQCRNKCHPGYLRTAGSNELVICGLDEQRLNVKWSGSILICKSMFCYELKLKCNLQNRNL